MSNFSSRNEFIGLTLEVNLVHYIHTEGYIIFLCTQNKVGYKFIYN